MELMIDHGYIQRQPRLQEAVLCTVGSEVCTDHLGSQLCSDPGMGCLSEPSFVRSSVHESNVYFLLQKVLQPQGKCGHLRAGTLG